MEVAKAKARKQAEREEAHCVNAQCVAKQAAAKAAKAMEKVGCATEQKKNQHEQALRAIKRVERRQTSISVVEVKMEQSRMVLVDVPQVCHSSFPSMRVPVDMHGRFLFSLQPPFLANHLSHSQLGTPLLSTLHSIPSDGLPLFSGPFAFPYYVS